MVSFHHGSAETSNLLRIFTKRAHADNRVSRIIIHINHRSQVHIDAECFEFLSSSQGYFVRNLLRINSPQRHVARKYGCCLPKSLHDTVFLVNGNEQRVGVPRLLRDHLQAPGKLKNLLGSAHIARQQDDTPGVVVLNQVDNFL